MQIRTQSGRAVTTAVALICLTAAALFLRNTTPGQEDRFFPPCLFHRATGWHCPGCGNTRATRALLQGDLPGALQQNVLFVLALPFLAWGAWLVWRRWIWDLPQDPAKMLRPSQSWVLIAVLISFAILRNLPWSPFTWLAPDEIPAIVDAEESRPSSSE